MMRRLLWVLLGLGIVLVLAWQWWQGPDPREILARIEVPPSPVLSPEQALETFRTAPGFRVELVAAEPLVVDPVAMDWDDEGRLYAIEMRGFMPDIDGRGEDRPVGRVVLLEDTDGDGRMDRSDVFLDGLVMPRAIAVLPEGVLVGEPPNLWLCRDQDGDRACDEKIRLTEYAIVGNPEHQENGLLAGLDGWIYNAKSDRRFQLNGETIEIQGTVFRGQWGIAQDDKGRLYYNHNSGFLYGDSISGDYAMRQPASAAAVPKPGVNIDLARGEQVFGIRVAPGLNRAYLRGTLRSDGRQAGPTAVSGLAIQRGDQYGPEFVGDAFVPEPGSSAVAHFAVERDGTTLRAEHRLYPDEQWGQREFLASTDERFRPVDADFGPDGSIWLIDMYRGVIQHADYVSDHLRAYVEKHDLEPPGATGRIWRVVREDRPITFQPPPLAALEDQLAGLDHPNGWVRDRAGRRLIFEAAPAAVQALRAFESFGPMGRQHALRTLDQMNGLDLATWRRALSDADASLRELAIRVGEPLLDDPGAVETLLPFVSDPDATIRIQALHSLGAASPAQRPLDVLLRAGREGDALEEQAVISSLAGVEFVALRQEIDSDRGAGEWLAKLAGAAHLAAQAADAPPNAAAELLDLIDSRHGDDLAVSLLEGIETAQRSPGASRVALSAPHPLFDANPDRPERAQSVLRRVRRHFTWPGDPRPGGARPLTAEEQERKERGAELYAMSCGTCHGAEGQGTVGLAPSLVGSPWVRDSDAWLVRIALGGLTGPIRIRDEEWNLTMPGHRYDPRFDDDGLAGVLTHLRRSWGHAEEPVAPASVAKIRAATDARTLPWTAAELIELEVDHRLDRYAGLYSVPIVAFEILIQRDASTLSIGMREGGRAPLAEVDLGLFIGEGITVEFEEDEEGGVSSASVTREGTTFPISRVE
ncbi:MAG: cytochrome c, class I [bacterium]|nr:cytochrome c, class I [bacterium]